MKKFIVCFLVVACLFAVQNAVLAGDGGGGAKGAPQILVDNNCDQTIVVLFNAVAMPTTVGEIIDAGGQFIDPGQEVSFDVLDGANTLSIIRIDLVVGLIIPVAFLAPVDSATTSEAVVDAAYIMTLVP